MIATSLKTADEVIAVPTEFFPGNPIATGFFSHLEKGKMVQGNYIKVLSEEYHSLTLFEVG